MKTAAIIACLVAVCVARPLYETPAAPNAGVTLSRTISNVHDASAKVTFASGCTSSDQYGSNDCSWAWGSSNKVTYNVALNEQLSSKAQVDVDLTIESIINLKFTCAVCGANCTFKVPIVGKTVNFALPPCPIKVLNVANSTSFALPAKNPLGLPASATGTITLKDDSGADVAEIDLNVGLS